MTFNVMNNTASGLALVELNKNTNKMSKSIERLSSGMRLSGANENVAEYAISQKMRIMIRSLEQDMENVKTGRNLVRTAEEGIQRIIEELRNMKAMALNSANDHNSEFDRKILQKEFSERMNEINDIVDKTEYNGKVLLDGTYGYKAADADGNDVVLVQNWEEDEVLLENNSYSNQYVNKKTILQKSPVILVSSNVTQSLTFNSKLGLKENTTIQGLFPAAVYPVKTTSQVYGMSGYGPEQYRIITESTTIYNPNYRSSSGDIYMPYTYIPPSGSYVAFSTGKAPVYLVGEEPGTHNPIALKAGTLSATYLDFQNLQSSASGSGDFQKDLHGQGFTILCSQCEQFVSIIFDSGKEVGYGAKYEDLSFSENIPIAYVIGVNGVVDKKNLEDAVFKGFARATNTWDGISTLPYSVQLSPTHNLRITRFRQSSGSTEYVLFRNGPSRFCIYEGIKGTLTAVPGGGGGDDTVPGGGGGDDTVPGGGDDTVPGGGDDTVPGGGGGGDTVPGGGGGDDTVSGGGGGDDTVPGGGGGDDTVPGGGGDIASESEKQNTNKRFEGNPLIIHTGPKANQNLRIFINNMRPVALGLTDTVIEPLECALESIGKLNYALEYAINENTRMGAYQIRLDETIKTLVTRHENMIGSESVIRDADMAREMMNYVKSNILSQASQFMLAQANQHAGTLLNLLQ